MGRPRRCHCGRPRSTLTSWFEWTALQHSFWSVNYTCGRNCAAPGPLRWLGHRVGDRDQGIAARARWIKGSKRLPSLIWLAKWQRVDVLTIMQRMQPSNSGYASEAPSLGPWARSQRWRPAWTASILDCVFYLFMPAKWTSSGLGGLQAIPAARKSRRWEQSEAWAHERLLVQWKNFLKRSKINWKRKSNQWSNQSSNQTINPKII